MLLDTGCITFRVREIRAMVPGRAYRLTVKRAPALLCQLGTHQGKAVLIYQWEGHAPLYAAPYAINKCGRLYWECGNCGRVALVLYVPGGNVSDQAQPYYLCRHCWGVRYASQYASRTERRWKRDRRRSSWEDFDAWRRITRAAWPADPVPDPPRPGRPVQKRTYTRRRPPPVLSSAGPDRAYCPRCRDRRRLADPVPATFRNGRPVVRGTCATCGCRMARIVGHPPA